VIEQMVLTPAVSRRAALTIDYGWHRTLRWNRYLVSGVRSPTPEWR
jgi:hypothetical protein